MTESILLDLLAKTPPAERPNLLDRLCDGRPDLRVWLELQLLAGPDSFGDDSKSGGDSANGASINWSLAPPSDQPGTMIGPYRLGQKLGEGGMGAVWSAEQTEPVQRKVALKLIKGHLDSSRVMSRFAAERQALALMDHPSIARIFDAGRNADGRPYFAMELVKGVPITKYCDEVQSSLEDRLKLFAQVCGAVQHAHGKGVIHRDLKPSNVLVAMQDGVPIPKVIDFGLAKALHQDLIARSMETEIGQVVGTLEYMAPEQAELSALDIDTRADVYALGVLLYELLVGSTPIGKDRLRKSAFTEILRFIKEEEPQRPSTRLSHSQESLANLAAIRRIDPKKFRSELKGELDWIVLKALEKDRTRRYETANAFKRDVERYLADEPVDAKPPSASYRLAKFARRNRAAVLAAGIVVATLAMGVAGLSWGLVEATRARSAEAQRAEGEKNAKLEAQDQREKAVRAAAAEEAAKTQALKRLAQVEKGSEVISDIFTDLDIRRVREGAEPLEAVLARRLVAAAKQLENESVGDPLVVASLQYRLGRSLLSLGHAASAIPAFDKARATRTIHLGADHPDTLTSASYLARAYDDAGKMDQALPLIEQTLKLRKNKLGVDHQDTFTSMAALASAWVHTGRAEEALPLLRETLELRRRKFGNDHMASLESLGALAEGLRIANKTDQAIPIMEELLRLKKQKLGADHSETLACMNNLASAFLDLGKFELAFPLTEEAFRLRKEKLGADHPSTLRAMSNLGRCYIQMGNASVGTRLLEDVLKIRRAKLGLDHPDTLLSIHLLAYSLEETGKLDAALALYEEAAVGIEKLQFQHTFAERIIPNTAKAYESARKFSQAEMWRRKWLAVVKERKGLDSVEYRFELAPLAWNLLQQKKWTDAEPILRENLLLREKNQPDIWSTFNSKSMLGEALLEQKKYQEAEPLLLAGYNGMKQRRQTMPAIAFDRMLEAVDRLIRLYAALNKPDQLKTWTTERANLIATSPAAAAAPSKAKK